MRRLFFIVSALALLVLLGPGIAAGQDVASGEFVACTVEPQQSFGFAATGDGTGASQTGWFRRFAPEARLPTGEVADRATVAAVDAVAQEWAACLNAGEFARSASLLAEGLAWPLHEQLGSTTDEVQRLLNGQSTTIPNGQRVAVGPARAARMLADGRVGALFDLTHGGLTDELFVLFSGANGRWRISDVIDVTPTPTAAAVAGYRVLAEFPHDPGAFTQGLTVDDDQLFEGTGQYGESTLRRVDLETGAVLQSVAVDERHFGEGIAIFDDRIYQITWQTRTCFVYDRETFEQIATFGYDTEGWGLTTNGERLIMSDGTSRIVFRDPGTFEETSHIDVHDAGARIAGLNELEYIDGEIWANVYTTDYIARIDPETGRVLGWIDLTGLLSAEDRAAYDVDVLNGIAYDADEDRILVTGKYWPKLFEIELAPPE